MFTHTRMALDVARSPSLVFMFRVIRHTACSKWNCLCLAIRHFKNSVPLLGTIMRPAQGLEFHYLKATFTTRPPMQPTALPER